MKETFHDTGGMLFTGPPDSSGLAPGGDRRTLVAQSILDLTQRVFSASTLLLGVRSVLEYLVVNTAAVGAVYIQVGGGQERTYHVRATWGEMSQHPDVQAMLRQGLRLHTPLMQALQNSPRIFFFDDTATSCETPGFQGAGVASLAASPVRSMDGELLGAFLMYTFTPHVWDTDEAAIFSLVAGTAAGLTGRLAANEQASEAREAALRAMGLALEWKCATARPRATRTA